MNILFVYSLNDIQSAEKPLRSPAQMQFGISYISSLLKMHGHQTRLVILSEVLGKLNESRVDKYIRQFSPDLVCFTAVATEYHFIAAIARFIKERFPGIYLIIGGSHASLKPEEVISDAFDALCIGEGEYPTLELISKLESKAPLSGISNLWIKQNAHIERNPTRMFISDLSSIPHPDRQMWQEWLQKVPWAQYSVLVGRGCPFNCTYCSNHALRKLAHGSYVRFRPPGDVIEEIKEIIKGHVDVKEIYLEVETISAQKNQALALCKHLEALNKTLINPLSFGVNLRITEQADHAELFEAFRKSNFRFINIGVESGSERVRREILRRNYSNNAIIKTVGQARSAGLKICFYNLIGLPGESREDFMQTVKINRECQPDWHATSIFYPYPGTDLYALCKKKGLIKRPSNSERERTQAILDMPHFTKKQIQRSYALFDYFVYRGYRPLILILIKVMVSGMRKNQNLNYLFEKIFTFKPLKQLKHALKIKYKQ